MKLLIYFLLSTFLFADSYREGMDALLKQDFVNAEKHLSIACESGDMRGCSNLGELYWYGDGLKKDRKKAYTLYEKSKPYYENSCDKGEYGACPLLAHMYGLGLGVKIDKKKSKSILKNACKKENYHACTTLGYFYEDGEYFPKDVKKAFSLYTKACENDEMMACHSLGRFYEKGIIVKEDFRRAKVLYKKSCKFGAYLACDDFKKITKRIKERKVYPPISDKRSYIEAFTRGDLVALQAYTINVKRTKPIRLDENEKGYVLSKVLSKEKTALLKHYLKYIDIALNNHRSMIVNQLSLMKKSMPFLSLLEEEGLIIEGNDEVQKVINKSLPIDPELLAYFLVKKILSPDSVIDDSIAPKPLLHYYAELCEEEHLKVLLNHGANVNIVDKYDNNALYAIYEDAYNRKSMKKILGNCQVATMLLLDNNIDMTYHFDDLLKSMKGTLSSEHYLVMQYLDRQVAVDKMKLFFWAIEANDLDIVKKTFSSEYLKHSHLYGMFPLHVAVSNGRLKIAKFLIDNGADIDEYTDGDKGNPPMAIAFLENHYEAVKLLVDLGADVTKKDKRGRRNIIEWCFYDGRGTYSSRMALLAYVMKNAKDVGKKGLNSSLFRAIEKPRHLKLVESYIADGADVNMLSSDGSSLLMRLATRRMRGNDTVNYLHMAEKLVKAGANLEYRDENNMTALLEAMRTDSAHMGLMFMHMGANKDVKCSKDYYRGNNALLFALENKNYQLMEFLLGLGFSPDVKNALGQSALELANEKGKSVLQKKYDPISLEQ